MTTALSPIIVSRLEEAATDNGFDQELEREGDWLVFASTQCRSGYGSERSAALSFSPHSRSRLSAGNIP